ncbi:MAG: hypothetical protein IJA26_02320 [Clostridia bacterium]|nr:hypothetical protein [Clostridia bacterium]
MGNYRRNILAIAATLAVMAGCGMLSAGRCVSAFYAQTGVLSWMGIGISCIIFGFLMGGIVRLKRKTGAGSLPALYAGLFGKRAGAAFTALHAAFFAACAWVLMSAASDAFALLLPLHHAGLIGMVFALLIALWLSRSCGAVSRFGGSCFLLLACLMPALAAFGRMPSKSTLHFYVELMLENRPWAAVLLAVIHASLAAGMCAGAAVRLFPAHIKPGAAGMASAAAYGFIMAAGNVVFCIFPPEINALKYPFVALTGEWGRAGHHICALIRYAECILSLCGICCALPGNLR